MIADVAAIATAEAAAVVAAVVAAAVAAALCSQRAPPLGTRGTYEFGE